MPNISSCLRMVLVFSTSQFLGKRHEFGRGLGLESWSFISRMRVVSWRDRRSEKTADRYGGGTAGL